jgi:hypothetical protein
MKRVISMAMLVAPMVVGAQETSAPARLDLQSFRIISERNIFNPNRSARRRESSRSEREAERRARVDSIALLGTMNYEKGWFAFFDGSSGDYRKTLQPGDNIAGYKVAEIAPNHIKLEPTSTNNLPVELRVGSQLRRQEDGPWEVSERLETFTASVATSSTETNSSAGETDIIKRLMQQREQELQK